jgi:hypothetical protein
MSGIVTPAGLPAREARDWTRPDHCPLCGQKLTMTMGGGGQCLKPDCGGYAVTAVEMKKEMPDG